MTHNKLKIRNKHFTVSIFGSARTQMSEDNAKLAFDIAEHLAKKEYNVVTGGGPGIMKAANAGHNAGDPENKTDSVGLTIQLPWEAGMNSSVEKQKHFQNFSNRLDTFMKLSNAVVVMPGGIGTCLELFFTWQLIQVRHIDPMPIIVVGEMWEQLIKWVKDYPLANGLISEKDMIHVHVVHTVEDVLKIVENFKNSTKK